MIDWFTVFAQIVNFLILVFLLKRFLYGPVISAMQKREEKIAERLREAQDREFHAEQERIAYQSKNEELDRRRSVMIGRAREESDRKRKEFIEEARREVETMKARWQEAVMREKESFLRILQKRTAEQVTEILRRAFADLADLDLERHMTAVFVQKLKTLDAGKKQKIRDALLRSGQGIIIAASFDMDGSQRSSVTQAVHDMVSPGTEQQFIVARDILCGIELRMHGYMIGWTVDEYLKMIEENFNREIQLNTEGPGGR